MAQLSPSLSPWPAAGPAPSSGSRTAGPRRPSSRRRPARLGSCATASCTVGSKGTSRWSIRSRPSLARMSMQHGPRRHAAPCRPRCGRATRRGAPRPGRACRAPAAACPPGPTPRAPIMLGLLAGDALPVVLEVGLGALERDRGTRRARAASVSTWLGLLGQRRAVLRGRRCPPRRPEAASSAAVGLRRRQSPRRARPRRPKLIAHRRSRRRRPRRPRRRPRPPDRRRRHRSDHRPATRPKPRPTPARRGAG